MSSIWSWSKTAADNSSSDDDINWSEGQAPSTVNNSARQMMARVAELLDDLGGSLEAGGTANALTFTSNSAFSDYVDGLRLSFRATADNTDAATLNVNGFGAKAIRKIAATGDADVEAGDIQAGCIYDVIYSTDLNSEAGGWQLMQVALPPARTDYVFVGFIGMFSGLVTDIPDHWALCDGSSGTPDLTDKFIVGAGGNYAVGDTGGAASVTLTTAQLPSHAHGNGSLATANAGGHSLSVRTANGSGDSSGPTYLERSAVNNTATRTDAIVAVPNHNHPVTGSTASAGSGDSHENRPPYYALAFIMYVG